jgi:hypothetical protein
MRMKRGTRRKFGQNGVVPANMTLPQLLLPELVKIILKFGFKGPSDSIQNRIRFDAGLTLNHVQTTQ